MREAIPEAMTSSTESSPTVSQARMSTRITLTMLSPLPKASASFGMSSETAGWTRAEVATRPPTTTPAPTTTAIARCPHRERARGRSEK